MRSVGLYLLILESNVFDKKLLKKCFGRRHQHFQVGRRPQIIVKLVLRSVRLYLLMLEGNIFIKSCLKKMKIWKMTLNFLVGRQPQV